jgi:hypothetical protein
MTEADPVETMPATRRRVALLFLLLIIVAGAIIYTQTTLFVVQPIGAVPEGRTLLVRRTGRLRFIDSADAVCQRETGGVSLLCRGAVLAAIAKQDRVIARLPYSERLYLISTGGTTYEK